MDKESIHTNIGFYLGFIAFIVQFILGFSYLLSSETFDQSFGQKALMEGAFGLIGLIFTDVLRGSKFTLKPKRFKKIDSRMFMRTGIVLAALIVAQIITQFIPITVRDVDMALAIMFAGPCEELFFRGFLMVFFIEAGKSSKNKIKLTSKREISYIEIIGIIFSSIAFAIIHTNYYNTPQVLIAIFLSGVVLGFLFWYWEDLTALMLGHFLLNIIAVGQMFWWQVNL